MKPKLRSYNEKRDRGLTGKIFYNLYKIKRPTFIRKFILKIMWYFLGNQHQFYSITLRKIFKDYHRIEVGLYSHGECFTPGALSTNAEIKIGRYCSIAKGMRSYAGNHTINTKSTHAFFFNPDFGYVRERITHFTKLKIGNDVWIGGNVTILPGCEYIGDGSIIGAGAVVNKNIPPFSIVVGNPARIVMKRFPDDKIQEVIASKWWEKSIEELEKEIDSFSVPLVGDSIR